MESNLEESSVPHGRDKKWRLENALTNHPIPQMSTQHRWILPKDAMPSTSKGWYKASKEPFRLTHKYSVCFMTHPEQFCVPNTSTPREGHTQFEQKTENFVAYQNFVQQKIFGGSGDNGFVSFAKNALDLSISDLQERPDHNEFKWCYARPRSRDDVMQLLFKDNGPGMKLIEEQNYGCAVAKVLMYACMVTRHGADSRRFEQGIEKWSNAHNYPFVMSHQTISGKRMDLHGLVSIARRVSCNVWYTNLAARMASRWRLKLLREKKVDQVMKGEFVVDVREWLPEKLRGVVFRDQYVVSLVRGGDEEVPNERAAGMAAMAGVVKNIKRSGLSKKDVDEMYAQTIHLVYGEEELRVNQAETGEEVPETPPRRTRTPPRKVKTPRKERTPISRNTPPPREARVAAPSPKRQKRAGVRGLLKKTKPSSDVLKIVCNPRLGQKVWCCKHAFSRDSKCTLAYCESCKNLMQGSEEEGRGSRNRRSRRGGGEDRVGTVVMNCDKGDCGRHTEADLTLLEDQIIDNTYLKATREKKKERGWQNVAEHCWNCGGMF